jgi:hypothetical protein
MGADIVIESLRSLRLSPAVSAMLKPRIWHIASDAFNVEHRLNLFDIAMYFGSQEGDVGIA